MYCDVFVIKSKESKTSFTGAETLFCSFRIRLHFSLESLYDKKLHWNCQRIWSVPGSPYGTFRFRKKNPWFFVNFLFANKLFFFNLQKSIPLFSFFCLQPGLLSSGPGKRGAKNGKPPFQSENKTKKRRKSAAAAKFETIMMGSGGEGGGREGGEDTLICASSNCLNV